jgi:type IV fimbrial biogenesis protein FimT
MMAVRFAIYRQRAFTLVELLVAVAVVGIILMIAAPSFQEAIDMRRLRGANSELVTDIQFARSEAVSRQEPVVVRFDTHDIAPALTCYTIHTCSEPAFACDCSCVRGAGNACAASALSREIRTVQILNSSGVKVQPVFGPSPPASATSAQMRFDPATGGMRWAYVGVGSADVSGIGPFSANTTLQRDGRTLTTLVNTPGRPSVCSPAGRVGGVPAC